MRFHPGYGFLAENAHFADVCESCHIKFIGTFSDAIRAMGDKNTARATARKRGVPVDPGSDGIVETEQEALKVAQKIGLPRDDQGACRSAAAAACVRRTMTFSLVQKFHAARMEAEKAFGNAGVYIEKADREPASHRVPDHGERHGNVVHIGERDCSMQRRNQKIIEECPPASGHDGQAAQRMGCAR
jgi:acetyl-CoA carboxylase biotin carboxylase subunit